MIFYTAIWLSMAAAVAVPEQMDAITGKLGEDTFFGVVLGVLGSVLYHSTHPSPGPPPCRQQAETDVSDAITWLP